MLEHDFQRDRSSEKHDLMERSNSSRGTVHTLGQAVRPGMFSNKPTNLFRPDYPTSSQRARPNRQRSPKQAQNEGTQPNLKAAKAQKDKGGSLEDKMTSLKDKIKIR